MFFITCYTYSLREAAVSSGCHGKNCSQTITVCENRQSWSALRYYYGTYLGEIRKAKRDVRLTGSEDLATAEVFRDLEDFRKKGYWINQRWE